MSTVSEFDEVKQVEAKKELFDPHRGYYKLHFENRDMDFALLWFLGTQVHGGCTSGEILYAASQIKDGDPDSWAEQFFLLAGRVVARAAASLQKGHTVSAREGYMRACGYYRMSAGLMSLEDPQATERMHKSQSCFRQAAVLFDPPIEAIEIPFEGTVLPGYFVKADKTDQKRKTLIMIGGGETFAEDQYFYIAPAAAKRGYHFLTVDLPGQGSLPAEKQFFRADTEVPMKAVLDYVLSRPDVDAERLAAYGISGGGYFVPRAAAHDNRIKACIANSAIIDMGRIWAATALQLRNVLEIMKKDRVRGRLSEHFAWRWGVTNALQLVAATRNYTYDPRQIACPMLIVIGEGEYEHNKEIHSQQHQCLDALPNPQKELVIAALNEGAADHCQNDNLALMSQIVFDWLDEVLA